MENKSEEKEDLDVVLQEKNTTIEELKEEVEKRKDSEDKLSNCIENLRLEIAHLKDKLKEGSFDETLKLKDEVKRLEYELRLQKDRTATDEVVMLRNDLRRAMEAEQNSKQAMDEFALVIREVASEANQAKEKLASAEQQIWILKKKAQNGGLTRDEKTCQMALNEAKKEKEKLQKTIDQLKAEAEESLLAWNEKEMEFVKCLKEEEDEKAKLKGENCKLLESLNDLEQESAKIKEETEKIKDRFKESFEEAEMAKAQSSELQDCLLENERKLTLFTQENVRLRRESEEKRPIPSASSQELILDDAEQETLASSKKDKKSHQVEEEPKKSAKKELKSHSHGGEEKEHKRLHRKEMKIKKEHKMSHGAEDKEIKKIKKDSSLDKELKMGNSHAKSYAIICFDPMAMLPIPGISSNKHKEAGDSNDKDDKLTDSIFDIVGSPPRQHRHRQHRRTTSSLDDEKSISSEEFEHEEIPHLDDMEVERAGAHSTKKGVLLRKFGDLWKRKNQGHGQNHHGTQNHNLNLKDVTT